MAADATAIRNGQLGDRWGTEHLLEATTNADSLNRSSDQPAVVIPARGMRTLDLGHGRTKSAETVKVGDKMGMAAQANDLLKVQKLLRRGVSVNARNSASGVTPLGVAAERGHNEMVKVLLEAKANVDDQTNDGMTPLHICCQFAQVETIKLLTAAGASVNTVARTLSFGHEDHSTPLMSATGRNSVATATALLEAKADVNAVPPRAGGSVVHLACRLGRADVLEVLLASGAADVTLRNREGETPLETALVWSYSRHHFRCQQLVRDRLPADAPAPLADKSDKYVTTAMARLARAIDEHRVDLVEGEGEEGGEELAAVPSELLAAYMRAGAAMGDLMMIKGLAVTHSDLVDVPDARKRTALHAACEAGHMGVATVLMANGADVNAQRDDGSTPLHVACAGDKPLVVKLLLRHGATQSIRDESGRLARDVATPAAAAAFPPPLPELGIS